MMAARSRGLVVWNVLPANCFLALLAIESANFVAFFTVYFNEKCLFKALKALNKMCAARVFGAVTSAAATSPMKQARNDALHLLFCHGLGSAKRDLISSQIQRWSYRRQVILHNIEYSNYGSKNTIWNINDWKADIQTELRRLSESGTVDVRNRSMTRDDYVHNNCGGGESSGRTIIVCNSAASQAVLRAMLDTSSYSADTDRSIPSPAGILMISPGIGMDVYAYMERLMPGSMAALEAGATLDHPSADPNVHVRVNLACLEEFVNNCPTRKNASEISIQCPIRIIHGTRDRLVPYRNSISLLDRLITNDKALYLINDGHFIKDQSIIDYALDSLWQTVSQQLLRDDPKNSQTRRQQRN